MDMEAIVDHYWVLGLCSGEEGAKLTNKEISKAYKKKALELHPDKRPNDPTAHANFQMLKSSYELLNDGAARKHFDELLKVRAFTLRDNKQCTKSFYAKRSDLDKREKQSFAANKAREEAEEWEEIARIFAVYKKTKLSEHKDEVRKQDQHELVDNDKVLKVNWENCGCGYTASRLRKVFAKFGQVVDVIINRKGSAVIVMASKEDAFSATRTLFGDLQTHCLFCVYKLRGL